VGHCSLPGYSRCSSFCGWARGIVRGQNGGILLVHSPQTLLGIARVQMAVRVLCHMRLVLILSFLAVIQLDLLEDELLVLRDLKTEQFEIEVKVTDWLARRLIIFEV